MFIGNQLAETTQDNRAALQAMQFTISSALNEPRGSPLARSALKDVAAKDHELFFETALAILDEIEDPRKQALAYTRVCEIGRASCRERV